MHPQHSPHPPRAFLIVDTLWAIVLVTVLLMSLTVAVVRQNKAQQRLAHTRAASRAAEDALLALQSGQPLPPNAAIEKLPDPAPPGRTWIRLRITTDNAQLVGLIPATATEGAK